MTLAICHFDTTVLPGTISRYRFQLPEIMETLFTNKCNISYMLIGSKKYDHITPVLKAFYWLFIRKRIEFKILLLTFKCMQGCAPLYLRELLVKQVNTRTPRSNTKNLLHIPHTNLKRFGILCLCTTPLE